MWILNVKSSVDQGSRVSGRGYSRTPNDIFGCSVGDGLAGRWVGVWVVLSFGVWRALRWKSVHWDWARDIGTGTNNGGSGVALRSPPTNPTVLGPDCMLQVIDSHSFVHFSALTTS
jgi:hypothetical protein